MDDETVGKLVDSVEDHMYNRVGLNQFEDLMIKITKELQKRYLDKEQIKK